MSTVGEALVGEGKEVAHIDLAIGEKGGAVEQAFMTSLASPRAGHPSLLAVLEPNLAVKPSTLVVSKETIKNEKHANLIFGPAQAAVAKAVMDSVEKGVIPKDKVNDLFIIVSVCVKMDAEDKKKIYEYNYEATKSAIERALKKEPKVDDLLAKKEKAKHPFAK